MKIIQCKIKYDIMQGNHSVMQHLLHHNLLIYASLQSYISLVLLFVCLLFPLV